MKRLPFLHLLIQKKINDVFFYLELFSVETLSHMFSPKFAHRTMVKSAVFDHVLKALMMSDF
jgi:hypothetical protein